MATIKVNKTEAAQRQIDTAVRLLFWNEDPVSIHTLTMAAFRILRDLAKKKGDHYLDNLIKQMIKPGMEGKFWGRLGRLANFLKHADSDPDETLDNVEEEVNDLTLFLAALYYQGLGLDLTTEMKAVLAWAAVMNPEMISEKAPAEVREAQKNAHADLVGKNRAGQLEIGRLLLFQFKSTKGTLLIS